MRTPGLLLALAPLLLASNLSFVPATVALHESAVVPPPPAREFRGAWVASVANIDWPSKPGLSTEAQQSELVGILDAAQRLNLNAVVLQVRPACDALYESRLEPWSEYLTGHMGQAPEPFYDPLKFAIDEAHLRGIELHAWFNPFRARHGEARTPASEDHISVRHPELVRNYGTSLWLDPSERAVQDHSIDVILDVVKRYDLDGVHIDDYFYPYKEKGPDGRILDFPDEQNWAQYQQSGGALTRDDWRRDQVNRFIERLYSAIKQQKAWVKFGISPFGIWRPGTPPTIKGFDPYKEIYADSRLWLNRGWVDYWSPQLYWKQAQVGQSYSDLLHWWVSQNTHGRHVWPGNYTSRVGDGSKTSWPPSEIVKQVQITRHEPGATGNLHFSMKALMQPATGVAAALSANSYREPTLIPASPWLVKERFTRPRLAIDRSAGDGDATVTWKAGKGKVWLWLVQLKRGASWQTIILPAPTTSANVADWTGGQRSTVVALTPVDRCGNLGPAEVRVLEDPSQPEHAPISAAHRFEPGRGSGSSSTKRTLPPQTAPR